MLFSKMLENNFPRNCGGFRWKDIIEQFFDEFVEFFFPNVYDQIDWDKGYEFLDQELQKVVREAINKNRRVDKLAKVWLKNGEEIVLYVHIEVQSQKESDFPSRVFVYHYRLYDRYGPYVTSLVILGDEHEYWRPRSYHYETAGTELSFCFPMVKLLDYQDKWDELEKSPNPFAMVVRVHLKGLETQKSPLKRFDWKVALYKALHEKNYSEKEIMGLFIFLDWLMTLPKDLNRQFDDFVHHYEQEKKMQYVTTFERKGIDKGFQQGVLQKSREDVLDILETRFQVVPGNMAQAIQTIENTSLLSKLHKEAVLIESVEKFEQQLEKALENDKISNTIH
jgi:hypothetical protein